MKRTRRWLASLLALALCLTLLPGTALAEDGTADWAADAVKTLNTIYTGYTGSENGPFSNSTGEMTEGDAASIASSVGWTTSKVTSGSDTPLSRSKACDVLADVFDLPIGSKSAIQYLYDQNIISGKANGDLDTDGNVSFAEFAVLTYRVLNSVGGGKTEAGDTFKPGDDGYFEWMYLAARKCVPFETTDEQLSGKMSDAKLVTSVRTESANDGKDAWKDQERQGGALWNAWAARLEYLLPESVQTEFKPGYSGHVEENTTLLTAAKAMVAEYVKIEGAAKTIFSDVVQGDYDNGGAYYDGVMYLFDQGILDGTGEGTFLMKDEVTEVPKSTQRYELAMLLYRADDTNERKDGVQGIQAAVDYVISSDNKFMAGTALKEATIDQNFKLEVWLGEWAGNATRQEAAVAILKFCEKKFGVDLKLEQINTAVLERFTADVNQISGIGEGESSIASADEVRQYLAYGVSHGMISGKDATTLAPQGTLNRGELGVLLYRTLIGLDTSKMHDYGQNVQNALGASAEP